MERRCGTYNIYVFRTRVLSRVADPHFCLAGPYPDPEGHNAEFLHKNLRNRFFFITQLAILYRTKVLVFPVRNLVKI